MAPLRIGKTRVTPCDTVTRKYTFLSLTLGSRSHEMLPVPSTSCHLFSFKV